MNFTVILGNVPSFGRGTEFLPINKGWSGDNKYRVTSEEGVDYLLRISPASQYDRRKNEFMAMQRIAALGIAMSRPIAFSTCDDEVYSLQSWIDGRDAEELIPNLPRSKQYAYGLEAGFILRTIHSIPAPEECEKWSIRFNRKLDRKLKMYDDCLIKFENDHVFIEYIRDNRHLIDPRPQCCQHGDYHLGNMMIDGGGTLQIIDFDRLDYGDPWEEFNRIVFSSRASPLFATGLVDRYFDGHVPEDFWSLLALYIASNTLSSLPWAIPFGQDQIDTMLIIARETLEWYDKMRNPTPTWYVKQAHEEYLHCEHSSSDSSP